MTRIKELREALGIKQEELAMLCNVTQSTISLWELGKTVPRRKALETLSERFGVSIGYILGAEGPESDQQSTSFSPKTPEARLISAGIDSMSEENRKRAVTMFNLMFAQFSQEGNDAE